MKCAEKVKLGDWICTSYNIKSGKFIFGKITSINFSECTEIDLDNNKTKSFSGSINLNEREYSRYFGILNKKEVNSLVSTKNKLEVIQGLKNVDKELTN